MLYLSYTPESDSVTLWTPGLGCPGSLCAWHGMGTASLQALPRPASLVTSEQLCAAALPRVLSVSRDVWCRSGVFLKCFQARAGRTFNAGLVGTELDSEAQPAPLGFAWALSLCTCTPSGSLPIFILRI